MSGFFRRHALEGMTVPQRAVVPPWFAVQMYHERKEPAPFETHSSSYCAARKHLAESERPLKAMGRLVFSI
eukprot:14793087-Alexandrium_andersonii.AAC.1